MKNVHQIMADVCLRMNLKSVFQIVFEYIGLFRNIKIIANDDTFSRKIVNLLLDSDIDVIKFKLNQIERKCKRFLK